jgi:hypothetical protein
MPGLTFAHAPLVETASVMALAGYLPDHRVDCFYPVITILRHSERARRDP